MIKIKMDLGAEKIISVLENKGYEAYAVGGCVRDAIIGENPDDWDITTSALPEKVAEIFSEYEVIPTGIKHGTVTVRLDGKNYEVTTFRTEGKYKDFRRPEKVEFVTDIQEDLRRRDFTVNSLAYNEKRGIIDLYGGVLDIENKVLRTVGDPKERFSEDALRILRGARFCSKLGFDIEKNTLSEMENLRLNLNEVAVERVFVELVKLLTGEYVEKALSTCYKILFAVIPELEPCYKFNQHSKWHRYDVFTHTVKAISAIENDPVLRFTMLLHDVGKPDKFFIRDGEGHFYGHAERSEEIASRVLKRLKAPEKFTKSVLFLIKNHDRQITCSDFKIKKALLDMGEENFFNLLKVKIADNTAQATPLAENERVKTLELKKRAEEIINRGDCYKQSQLKINGDDLIKMGFSGKQVGEILNSILLDVTLGNIQNERERLLTVAEKRKQKSKK